MTKSMTMIEALAHKFRTEGMLKGVVTATGGLRWVRVFEDRYELVD